VEAFFSSRKTDLAHHAQVKAGGQGQGSIVRDDLLLLPTNSLDHWLSAPLKARAQLLLRLAV
jgi:hypothetical protein